MAKMTPREKTAYHEAGHAVMAVIVGSAIRRITIRPRGEYSGLVSLWPFRVLRDPSTGRLSPNQKDKIERRIAIYFAGPIAESHATGRPGRKCSHNDGATIMYLADLMYSGKVRSKYLAYLHEKTKAAITDERTWPAVEWLAKHLLLRGSISGKEATAFVVGSLSAASRKGRCQNTNRPI